MSGARVRLDAPPHLAPALRVHLCEVVGGSLRHALKNKLGAIRNAGYLLRKRLEPLAPEADRKRTAQLFDVLADEVVKADGLLEALRLLPPPPPAQADVHEVAGRLLGALRAPATIALRGPGAGSARAEVDPVDLELALFLLLENSVESLGERGGQVTIDVEPGPAVHVRDDGPGFGEARERALEPFFSTRGRCGVGLKVAQRVVARWGGELRVGDREGGGAQVTLVLRPAGGVA